MEITTANYLQDLVNQKENLVSTLQGCGVEANSKDTFDILIPKVEETYEAGRESIVNESKDTIITVSAKDVDENPHWSTFEYPLTITDVSDIPHKVKVYFKPHGDIFDTPILVINRNGTEERYEIENVWDTTYEFDSASPNMSFTIISELAPSIEISVTYLKSWGIQYGIDYGAETERTNFWDNFFSGTLKNGYGRNLFAGGGWNNKNFTPIFPEGIISITNAERMFDYFNRDITYRTDLIDLTELCEHLDFSKAKATTYIFCNARAKNITIDLSSSTSLTQAFNCGNGGEFENLKIKVSELCTSYNAAFGNMYYIKNLIFLEGSVIAANISFEKCYALNHESLMSIINALKDYRNVLEKTYSDYFSLPSEEIEQYVYEKKYVITGIDNNNIYFIGDDNNILNISIIDNSFPIDEIKDATNIIIHEDNSVTFFILSAPKETKILTLGATNLEKLTNEEKVLATQKGWTLA